ncbi:MAG: hypothetical protein LAT50_19425 [Ectothiorhodospiraceae bacterium]|nr:hypothetical protein [Ectothiorhodospiraceae bacterium]
MGMNDALDLPDVLWRDAAHALAWAEEVVSRPDCANPTGRLIRSLKRGELRSSPWTPQDYRDLAETVMVCMSMVPDHKGREAFRAVYGLYDQARALRVAEELAKAMMERPAVEGKTYSQVSAVCKVAVHRERSRQEWSRPMGMQFYAAELDIRRERLYDGKWTTIIRETEELLKSWASRGESGLAELLGEKGLL